MRRFHVSTMIGCCAGTDSKEGASGIHVSGIPVSGASASGKISLIRDASTSYSGWSPSPLGHHSLGFSIENGFPFSSHASDPSGSVSRIETGRSPLCTTSTVSSTRIRLSRAARALSAPAVRADSLPSASFMKCRWRIRISLILDSSHPSSRTSRQIPPSGSLGPQSHPNMQCALRRCGNPRIAS